MWWNSETVMVQKCGGTGEQSLWKSVVEKRNSVVEQWNSDGGTVEQSRWNSGTVMLEQCGGTVWWNNRTVMVQQWNSDGGTVEQSRWNSGTVMLEQCGGKVEQSWWNSMVEQ